MTALTESPSARALRILEKNQQMMDAAAGKATRQLFEPRGLFALRDSKPFALSSPLFTPPRSPIVDVGASIAGQIASQRASLFSLRSSPLGAPPAGIAALLAGRTFTQPVATAFAGLVPRMTFASLAPTSVPAMFAGTAFTSPILASPISTSFAELFRSPKFDPVANSLASLVPPTGLASTLFAKQQKLFAEPAGLASYRRVNELVASQLDWQRNLVRLFEPSDFRKQFGGLRQPSWEEVYGVALEAFAAEARASARLTPRQRADIALVLAEAFSFALDSKLSPATRGQVALVLFVARYFLVAAGLLPRD